MDTNEALEALVGWTDVPFSLNKQPASSAWDELDISPSLILEHSRFPRHIVHSNRPLQHMLNPAVIEFARCIDKSEAASHAFDAALASARRDYNRGQTVLDLLNSTSYMMDAYFTLINRLVSPRGVSDALVGRNMPLRRWRAAGLGKTRWSDWTLLEPASGPARGKLPATTLVNVELTTDGNTPRTIFEGIANMAANGGLAVGRSGRVRITDQSVRAGLDEHVADGIERWTSQIWCQMLQQGVRFAILTSISNSLLFHVDEGVIEVTDCLHASSGTLTDPCRSLLPLFLAVTVLGPRQYRLPECYASTEVVPQLKPTIWRTVPNTTSVGRVPRTLFLPFDGAPDGDVHDLTFKTHDRGTLLRNAASAKGSQTVQVCLTPESVSLSAPYLEGDSWLTPELGPPSLFIRLGRMWKDFDRLRCDDVRHSLGRVRRLPEVFHGPIEAASMSHGCLPILGRDVAPRHSESPASLIRTESIPVSGPMMKQSAHQALTPSPVYFRPQILELQGLLSYGAVWDVYRVAVPEDSESSTYPLVAKMFCVDAFPVELDPKKWAVPYSREGMSQCDIRLNAFNEITILGGLAAVPDVHVPRVIGLWGSLQGDKEVWVMVMEDVGPEVDVASMSLAEKMAVIHQYECLHAAGYLHNDCEVRHWRRRNDVDSDRSFAPVRIIDFDRASRKTAFTDEEWAERTAFEMLQVRGLLKLRTTIRSWFRTVEEMRELGRTDPATAGLYGLPDFAVATSPNSSHELHERPDWRKSRLEEHRWKY